jgi:putative hydrolase of HD superfamily
VPIVKEFSESDQKPMNNFQAFADFLGDVERHKLVTRRAFVSDLSRRENSAEHSWHMAVGLQVVARELGLRMDLGQALAMVIIHGVREN